MSVQWSSEDVRRSELELLRVLAEAATAQEAAGRVLELVATTFGWAAGILWLPDAREELLHPADAWCGGEEGVLEFCRVSRRLTFGMGVGLPGRAWEEGEAVWLADIVAEQDIPRAREAARAGLHGAVALPVRGPRRVRGVLELFAREARPRDEAQLEALELTSRQLGQYLARVEAEERLRESEEHRAQVVAAALDCVWTMDHDGLVVDVNPAAEATFGYARDEAVGRPLADLIIPPELRAAHYAGLRRYLETGVATILNRRLELEAVRADGSRLPVELTVTRLGHGSPAMFAGFVRDLSERRDAEAELARLLEREHAARLRAEQAERDARRVSEVLQRSLLPPHLPVMAGLELGSAYRPGMEGSVVGGDFYDVFELGDGRWGVAVGDVRGKGADAAAVTALVRSSIRTAAVREDSPARVLGLVNSALLRSEPEGELCTAVFALLRTGAAPALRLAIGGHPPPLVLRASGSVEEVGRAGTMLGVLEDPSLPVDDVALAPGDAVLLYTDGVTECRTASGRLGVDGLAELLAGCVGLDAPAIAERIDTAAAGLAERSIADDVALLCLRAVP